MRCICNNKMIWQNDFDFEDLNREGTGIVSRYICTECDSEFDHVQEEKGE
jgi:hypothetical protein